MLRLAGQDGCSPATHGTAAIDPLFTCSTIVDEGGETNFSCYWSGTTHMNWTRTNNAGRPVPSGLYFAKLSGPDGILVKKMLLAK